jgi:cobalt-zinc-cadmium efflux system protein
LSLDAAPRDLDLDAIENWLRERPGVADLHDLHVWALSTTQNALTVHLVAEPSAAHPEPLALSAGLAERFGLEHNTIQVEAPDGDCPAACGLPR